jgi:ABC-type sugar transport system ATPase subunit
VLLLDEPSLGLSPIVVAEVLSVVSRLKASGIAIVLVEQFIREALKVADHAAVLEQGHIVLEGPVSELSESRIAGAYLGGEAADLPGRGVAGAPSSAREKVALSLPGLDVRKLERAAAAAGTSVDDVVEAALAKQLRAAPKRRRKAS